MLMTTIGSMKRRSSPDSRRSAVPGPGGRGESGARPEETGSVDARSPEIPAAAVEREQYRAATAMAQRERACPAQAPQASRLRAPTSAVSSEPRSLNNTA